MQNIDNLFAAVTAMYHYIQGTQPALSDEEHFRNIMEVVSEDYGPLHKTSLGWGLEEQALVKAATEYQSAHCLSESLFHFRDDSQYICTGTIPSCAQEVLDYQAEHNVAYTTLDPISSGICLVNCC